MPIFHYDVTQYSEAYDRLKLRPVEQSGSQGRFQRGS